MSKDTIKVWNILHETELNSLKIEYTVNSIALSPSGKRAFLATRDKIIKVLDTKDLHEEYALQGHDNWVTGVSISADDRTISSESSDKTIKKRKLSP